MTFRWAVASTGRIASSFARALGQVPDAELVAVGSRTRGAADDFAARHGVPRVHGTIESLASDDEVDVVYVAGIHPVHRAHAEMMMHAGRHVLVEKPLAMRPGDVASMVEVSRTTGQFLMEAMWMRFNPLHLELKRLVDSGALGRILRLESDFSFAPPRDPASRLFDPAQGGGAMLDVGVYPACLALWWLGVPRSVGVAGTVGPTGVDEAVELELEHDGGATSRLTCAINREGARTTTVTCEGGEIMIPAWSHASSVAEIRRDGAVERVSATAASLHHQVNEVHARIPTGSRESAQWTHGDSAHLSLLVDRALADLGLR